MEVLVVGNTAYVDDDFCAKAFPGDMSRSSLPRKRAATSHRPMPRGKSFCNTWIRPTSSTAWSSLSNYLTPHTDTVGDIELLRSVFRACMGRRVQLLYVAGPAGAEGAADAAGRTGKGIIAHAANDLCRYYAAREGVQTKILRVPFLYTASPRWRTRFWCRCSTRAQPDRSLCRARRMRPFPRCVPRSLRCWYAVSSIAGMVTLRRST